MAHPHRLEQLTTRPIGLAWDGVVSVPHGADNFGQPEGKHSCAWSVVLDILGIRVVQGPESRGISC
jgi:hypothetical protein